MVATWQLHHLKLHRQLPLQRQEVQLAAKQSDAWVTGADLMFSPSPKLKSSGFTSLLTCCLHQAQEEQAGTGQAANKLSNSYSLRLLSGKGRELNENSDQYLLNNVLQEIHRLLTDKREGNTYLRT